MFLDTRNLPRAEHIFYDYRALWGDIGTPPVETESTKAYVKHLITIIAPKIARETPIIFLEVMGSFKKTLANIIINTVESWLYIAALPAMVYLYPASQKITER